MELKVLYKTRERRELCLMPPLEIRRRVSIPESGIHKTH